MTSGVLWGGWDTFLSCSVRGRSCRKSILDLSHCRMSEHFDSFCPVVGTNMTRYGPSAVGGVCLRGNSILHIVPNHVTLLISRQRFILSTLASAFIACQSPLYGQVTSLVHWLDIFSAIVPWTDSPHVFAHVLRSSKVGLFSSRNHACVDARFSE